LGAGASGLLSASELAIAARSGATAEIATGCVFEDLGGTGHRWHDEPGIANVMVSNGRDVTLTGADGKWRLPVRSGDSIFVVKPSHWEAALVNGIPRTYYHYQPEGTPASLRLGFAGVKPSGRLPRSIDFGLRRRAETTAFEALLFADMQPGNAKELGFVRDETLAAIQGTTAAFAINHGDVMGDDLGLFPDYRQMLARTGIAWHHCPGNHDMNLDTPSSRFAFETWKREIGPTHSAFQHAGATFILLNNVEFLEPGQVAKGGRAYRGRIGRDQLTFVRNVLRHVPEHHLVVVSMHIPLLNFEDPAIAVNCLSC